MKMIKYLAGGTAMALSMSSMAVGYSSVNNPVSGDLPSAITATGQTPVEQHMVQSFTTPGTCNSVCEANENQESEVVIMLELVNRSGCTPTPATPDVDGRTCAGTPTVDYYSGDSAGNGSAYSGAVATTQEGDTPSVEHLQVYRPFSTTVGGHWSDVGESADLGGPGVGLFDIIDWDIYTAPNGKITSGHAVGAAIVGSNVVGTFNFTDMTFTTYYGDSGYAATIVDCLVDGPHNDTVNCNNATPLFEFSRSFPFEYVTAGMAQLDLGKAVPVPAFAAAALGLGLVGITLLTGRRRQIK